MGSLARHVAGGLLFTIWLPYMTNRKSVLLGYFLLVIVLSARLVPVIKTAPTESERERGACVVGTEGNYSPTCLKT